jgi:hypothetical protein
VASCFVGYACFMLDDYSRALRVLQAFGRPWLGSATVGWLPPMCNWASSMKLARQRLSSRDYGPGLVIGAGWRIAPFRNSKDDAEHFFGASRSRCVAGGAFAASRRSAI